MNEIIEAWGSEAPSKRVSNDQESLLALYNEQIWPYQWLSLEQVNIASHIIENYRKLRNSESDNYSATLENWMSLTITKNSFLIRNRNNLIRTIGEGSLAWVTKCTLESDNWVIKFYIKINPKEWQDNSYKLFINDQVPSNAKEVAEKLLKSIDDHLSGVAQKSAVEKQKIQDEKDANISSLIKGL